MAHSSILGGERAPRQAAGRDTDALGPSDTSDSGSDIQGEIGLETPPPDADRLGADHTIKSSDTDASGTGERASALPDELVRDGADISPDQLIDLVEQRDEAALDEDLLLADELEDDSPVNINAEESEDESAT